MTSERTEVAGHTVTVPAESEGPVSFDFPLTWMDAAVPAGSSASRFEAGAEPVAAGSASHDAGLVRTAEFLNALRRLVAWIRKHLAQLPRVPRPVITIKNSTGLILLFCFTLAWTLWMPYWSRQPGGNGAPHDSLLTAVASPQPREPARGAVARAEVPPRPLRIVPARYTAEARYARFKGKIFAVVTVDTHGRAQNLEFTAPVPFSLDVPAWQAARNWRFRPAMRGGNAVERRTVLEVPFR